MLPPKRRLFQISRRPEAGYTAQLRAVARQVGNLVGAFTPGDPEAVGPIRRILTRYAEALDPWARATAARMIAEVTRRNDAAWMETSRTMARALHREIFSAPTGQVLRDRLDENVHLITSLPREAAERVHDLTLKGIEDSTRASEIAKAIQRTGDVTEARAKLIARTEVARTASTLTQARSLAVGSDGYIWRTVRDSDVRDSHRKMEGVYVRWAEPPELSDGTVTHAGQIYNCRCYPEPVLPDFD